MYTLNKLREWWEQNMIADDPEPEYSLLDRLDGLSNNGG